MDQYALAILDAALDAVITIDHRGHVLEFNRSAEQMFGYERSAVLGQELAAFVVPPDLRDAHRRGLARWTAEGAGPGAGSILGERFELRAMRADGTEFPAEIAISRVDVPGPPIFTSCVRDLSARREAEDREREAKQRYRVLVEQLPVVSYIDESDDPLSRPLYISPQVETLLGRTPTEWLATPGIYERSIHPEDREWVLGAKRKAYERREPLGVEYRMLRVDDRVVWVEDHSVYVIPDTGGAFRQGYATDISERKRAENAIKRAETQFRGLVEQLPLAVYIDRLDDVSSNVYTSPQIEPMLGYSAAEWAANRSLFVQLLHPDDREAVLAAHAATHATGVPLRSEYRLIARDGRTVWVQDEARVSIDAETGDNVLQGYLLDITLRRDAEEQLRHQAFHDPLTGLANRALFIDRVEHALVSAAGDAGAAVLFLDLDDFKGVNDTLGHAAGDALLRAVGDRLRTSLSSSHTVARLGGDEFAVLLERATIVDATDAAARLIDDLKPAFDVPGGHELFVTASIGIAVGSDAATLIRSADVAMYRAKASGKSQYVVHAPLMDHDVGRLELTADLRRARVEDEFFVVYQPIVELETRRIVGAEALARWKHPTRGVLGPAAFVPLAEETGRIVDIGRFVLGEACARVARWRAEIPAAATLSLSVNVSTRQVGRPGLLEHVRWALDTSGLDPSALVLEITESMFSRRREEMVSILEEVTHEGVRFGLDDFGTGYSSLSLLQHLPVHVLKIDRSFVSGVARGPENAAFVHAIVELARALGLPVIAEGVESPQQVAALRGLGCRLGQGYHFAEPLSHLHLADSLARGPLSAARPAAA